MAESEMVEREVVVRRKLTPTEMRYLARHVCAWCDQPLHKNSCGAVYEKCSLRVREQRRADCLGARVAQVPKTRRAMIDAAPQEDTQ